jgi:dephospho-CoA kinase
LPGPSLIGLTGGIAAGKSEALRILGELGAAAISTDELVHELLAYEEVRKLLTDRWGAAVAPGGALDRARIAAIVFERPEELDWLESHLHPRVGERVDQWRRALPEDLRLAVVEVPLLFEGRMAPIFDATVAVVADDRIRAQRAADRGIADLEARSAHQLSQEEKAGQATWVVRNDGHLDHLRARLVELLPALESAAEPGAR